MPSDVDGSASDLGDVMAESSTTDPVVSIVLPTFNEGGNIVSMLERLDRALADLPHELIVVDDDSPDETWRIAQEYAADHPGIHVIRRSTERGLSSAVLAGMRAARGRVLGVIDADGQHDEAILPEMTERVLAGADICIGSRAVEGGGYGDWGKGRRFASWLATAMAHMMLQVKATDPMSGFFVVRDHYEALQGDVNPRGFKVLLEFLSRSEPKVDEVGYVFRNREGRDQALRRRGARLPPALIELRFGLIVSAQFTRCALVGSVGLLINLVAFLIAFGLGALALIALLIGIQISIVFNFTGHNLFSFRPTNYRGKRWWKGLAVMGLQPLWARHPRARLRSVGRPALERLDSSFWAAGLSNLLAIGMAAVANYLLHERFTWGRLGLELSRPKRSRR
ncbi:MAG: glycosyltransferase family 2 protein [Acidimicrobiales bacterium]